MRGKRDKILIVDSDLDTLHLLVEIYKQLDSLIQTDSARSAGDLIHYLSHCQRDFLPRLIVMIHRLPSLNVLDLLRITSEQVGREKIVKAVMSARHEPFLKEHCIDAGANHFYMLPHSPSDVKRVAISILREANMSKDLTNGKQFSSPLPPGH